MNPAEVIALLADRAARDPDGAAIEHNGVRIGHRELHAQVAATAERLKVAPPAGWVGVLAGNDPDTVVAVLGLLAAGTTFVLLDARATDYERATVASAAGIGAWYPAAAVLGGLPAHAPSSAGADPDGESSFALVTSGTGGLPKVVRKRWAATLANSAAFAQMAGYCDVDRILCTTPLHHAFAFGVALLPAALTGATLVLAPHPVAPSRLAGVLAESGATVVQAVPFLYRAMLTAGLPRYSPDLRICVSAGEPLPGELARQWYDATGIEMRDQYGATEFGQIAYAVAGMRGQLRLVPGVQARVRDDKGRWLDDGGFGELFLRQDGASVQYLGAPGTTPSDEVDGWFRSGDVGRLTGPRELVLEGRTGRRIILGGRKVDPDEVEAVVGSHPGVRECRVAAPPEGTPGRGDRFVAFVEARPGVTETDLRRYVAGLLSPYKIPTRFYLAHRFPRTGSGKIHMARLWKEVTG